MQSQENKIIELTNVGMRYDKNSILKDVNLTIYDGDFIAVTGPNGGGKTTLLKIILRLLKPTSGNVTYWKDNSITDELKIGYLPQKNMIDSNFPIAVKDVVRSGMLGQKKLFSKYTKADEDRLNFIMNEMGIKHLADEAIGNLSGGQLQRTLLGRALISSPHVLVLDEPLSYVDKRFERQIYDIIAQLAPKTTIILVSHEMTAIAPMATRHIIVDHSIHFCHAKEHYSKSECE